MSAAISKRVEQLFSEARELAPEQRDRFLAKSCGQDLTLRREVDSLLNAADHASDYFGPFAERLGIAALFRDEPDVKRHDEIGPYRLKHLLGRGGMGEVWLAERSDGLINRPVALKLPRALWSQAGLAERMAREREILASLNHPHIARLYDAGLTADGQPYLALEYVEGQPIDKYCKDYALDTRARLDLFLQAAQAIAYAHAQLIVHRDLKPANILVTKDGEVRLLDFGIAKLLEHGEAKETRLTQVAGRALTPDYASPEQITGEPVTIASDIYSLGVLLYELLTGRKPYRLRHDSLGALEDAIVLTEPLRPSEIPRKSSHRKALRGDLDTIVLKALKKDPKERYATANALIEDIQRHLTGRPVLAQPDSCWYVLRKFVWRNKLAVAAATAVLAAIVSGAAVSIWQAQRALIQKDRAEQVKEFIASIFRDADPNVSGGKLPSAIDLLRQARGRLDLAPIANPDVQAELRNILGTSLIHLTDYDTAEAVLQPTLATDNGLNTAHPKTLRARVLLAQAHRFQGKTEQASEELEALLPELRRGGAALQEDLIRALTTRADLAVDQGRYEDAINAAEELTESAFSLLGEQHKDSITALTILAAAYAYAGEFKLALSTAEHAHRLALATYADHPQHPVVIDSRGSYARALADTGQLTLAVEMLTIAVKDASEVYGDSSMTVGLLLQNLVDHQLRTGLLREALAGSKKALSIIEANVERDSLNYIAAVNARGKALLAARRGEEALEMLKLAYDGARRIFGATHGHALATQARVAVALTYAGRLDEAARESELALQAVASLTGKATYPALWARGVLLEALGDYRKAKQAFEQAFRSIEADSDSRLAQAEALAGMGMAQTHLGEFDAAVRSLERSRVIFSELYKELTPVHADTLAALGRVRFAQGKLDEALPLLVVADEFWRNFDPDSRWAGEAAWWLADCYARLGKTDEAQELLARAKQVYDGPEARAESALARLEREE